MNVLAKYILKKHMLVICLVSSFAGFFLQTLVNQSLNWLRAPQHLIFAYHPSFPDAKYFQSQREKFLISAVILKKLDYEKIRRNEMENPSAGNLPGLWLGALFMVVGVPSSGFLIFVNSMAHALLIGLMVWHLQTCLNALWQALSCVFLLPSILS